MRETAVRSKIRSVPAWVTRFLAEERDAIAHVDDPVQRRLRQLDLDQYADRILADFRGDVDVSGPEARESRYAAAPASTPVSSSSGGGAKTLVGYGAVFYDPRDPGTEYQLTPQVRERVSPRAFDRTLKQNDVLATLNHSFDWLLGRRSAGTLRLSVDQRGLRYEIDHDPHDPQHVSVMRKVIRGDLSGSSFMFIARKESVQRDSKGDLIRVLEDVDLLELGPVAMPAYPSTTAGARGLSVREASESPVARRLRQLDDDAEREREADARQRRLRLIEIDLQQDRDRLLYG